MSSRENYRPGPAAGAEVRKDGQKWTLTVVRELRHPPEKVWKALTDPASLREWAPFDADGSLGTVGTVKLTTLGAPTLLVSDTKVTRADAPKVLEYEWGDFDMRWELEALVTARASRCGTVSIAASSRWVLPGGTFVSTFWIAFSAELPSAASSAAKR